MRIDVLSRFRTPPEQAVTLKGLRDGAVDIVIGTHRVLQKDVHFSKLGLVVVDDEQRFGVVHKEWFKQLRREVDVLTLTATPIPRTLSMALAGVRDMTTVHTPPQDRQPVRTFVCDYSDSVVQEALLRELDRGGQVFFLHNRIRTIDEWADRVQRLAPQAKVAVGHGRMDEEELAAVMNDFMEGRTDVLVSTTIIEAGLDLPNANTILVHRPEMLGLAQMYQLRGRVGRGARHAYAYFLITPGVPMTEAAQKRLKAMLAYQELGAGFRIAMKDLEIRGAGNHPGPGAERPRPRHRLRPVHATAGRGGGGPAGGAVGRAASAPDGPHAGVPRPAAGGVHPGGLHRGPAVAAGGVRAVGPRRGYGGGGDHRRGAARPVWADAGAGGEPGVRRPHQGAGPSRRR